MIIPVVVACGPFWVINGSYITAVTEEKNKSKETLGLQTWINLY